MLHYSRNMFWCTFGAYNCSSGKHTTFKITFLSLTNEFKLIAMLVKMFHKRRLSQFTIPLYKLLKKSRPFEKRTHSSVKNIYFSLKNWDVLLRAICFPLDVCLVLCCCVTVYNISGRFSSIHIDVFTYTVFYSFVPFLGQKASEIICIERVRL